ncbi:hypothetical protein DNI29_00870 [Hymenobacter sediminis]|uniref:right-handed parallel beta-helix repeat-containing protein n=1 Tax=Hymenobacter sediminis TaxID=2218621 RepID=UPI000DA6AAE5|nr:right-handed parallel beta-helix repeat-containing protein [Hymenobacter sediminis]RPD49385.1 hypothetical protein DNI29_00870 [Hymenobacter sediminis]
MRFLLPLLLLLSAATVLLPGCEPKEDIVTTDSSARLEFSLDTVKFDTVFVTVGTVSKRLWVYNRNPRAVRVSEISLQNQPGITYSLLINGDAGSTARDVEIRGKDSLLVLIRATVDPTPNDLKPFLLVDDLRFRTNGNDQQVKVVSYGQNAYFHNGEEITEDKIWKSDKPHVIFNYVRVAAGKSLTIEPGARIYSHAGAALLVAGQLLVNPNYKPTGELKLDDRNFVRFQGDRREEMYANTPGQWGGIWFLPGSQNNVVRFAEIKNSTFGLLAINPNSQRPFPNITIENSTIQNISSAKQAITSSGLTFGLEGAAILGVSADYTVRNTLITNCEQYAVFGVQGGTYQFDYCTIANYTIQANRQRPTFWLSNAIEVNEEPRPPLAPRLLMRNSIVWGNDLNGEELIFRNGEQYAGNISISNSVLRTKAYAGSGPLAQNKNGNILNPLEGPNYLFRSTFYRKRGKSYDYQLDTLSPASNKAAALPNLTIDLLNRPRLSPADIGAFERKNP